MSAVTNHVAIPFFNRVPARVNDVLISTFDNITEKGMSLRESYHFLANSVKKRGVEGATYTEFEEWYARVKNGLIDRPHPSESLCGTQSRSSAVKPRVKEIEERCIQAVAECLVEAPAISEPSQEARAAFGNAVETGGLEQARAIVDAADRLFEAKLAGGFSPLSLPTEDTIVAEALRQLLEAEGPGIFANPTSNALDSAVSIVIDRASDEQMDQLLNILTMDMQPALCRALARRDRTTRN